MTPSRRRSARRLEHRRSDFHGGVTRDELGTIDRPVRFDGARVVIDSCCGVENEEFGRGHGRVCSTDARPNLSEIL
jgi:hypothetical protein